VAVDEKGVRAVSTISAETRTQALFAQGAELRLRANRLTRDLSAFCRDYENWQANLREDGTQSDFLMEPPLEGGYDAWRRRGPERDPGRDQPADRSPRP
jgi:hypothetical protein